MARTFANVARSEIPSWKFVRLSSSFLFAFAAKFLGSNPKGERERCDLFLFAIVFHD